MQNAKYRADLGLALVFSTEKEDEVPVRHMAAVERLSLPRMKYSWLSDDSEGGFFFSDNAQGYRVIYCTSNLCRFVGGNLLFSVGRSYKEQGDTSLT